MKEFELEERYGIKAYEAALCGVLGVALGLAVLVMISAVAAFFSAALVSSMSIIMLTDNRRMLVPDALSLPMIPVGLVATSACLPGQWFDVLVDHALAAALGAGALLALRWIYLRTRGIIGLGLGDVKLAAVAGAWLGVETLPVALLFASCAALVATLLSHWLSAAKTIGPRTAVPFGSFIAPAIAISWVSLLLMP